MKNEWMALCGILCWRCKTIKKNKKTIFFEHIGVHPKALIHTKNAPTVSNNLCFISELDPGLYSMDRSLAWFKPSWYNHWSLLELDYWLWFKLFHNGNIFEIGYWCMISIPDQRVNQAAGSKVNDQKRRYAYDKEVQKLDFFLLDFILFR